MNEIIQDNPLIFGEVLFDCFEDGSKVLGGAPFNVAWNLRAFGNKPLFMSAVGQDASGKKILGKMSDWGLDTHGVKIDDTVPTGQVQVGLKEGQPSFSILPDQAYDNIQPTNLEPKKNTILYHGSLALRSENNKKEVNRIIFQLNPLVFVDINLRHPWWDMATINAILNKSHWLKINDDELNTIAQELQIKEESLLDKAKALINGFDIKGVIVTQGSEGAFLATPHDYEKPPLIPVHNLVDTVGAGDAFAAVCLHGLLHNWDLNDMMFRAQTFASRVCEIRGAVSEDPSFYQKTLNAWDNNG